MADKKISALTAASTPLAGTEVLPIVQGGATVKVPVANLTAGRSVSMSDLTVASSNYVVANFTTSLTSVYVGLNNSIASSYIIANGAEVSISPAAGGNTTFAVGDARITNGNFVPSTAAKGINFTANTPAAGMTSQLLNWYEEGTWTPNQGSGLTVVGAFSSSGTYVRIGRLVTVRGQVQGATSVSATAAGVISSNLPFVSAADTAGSAFNGTLTVSNAIDAAGSAIYSAGAFSPTVAIYFSVSYMV